MRSRSSTSCLKVGLWDEMACQQSFIIIYLRERKSESVHTKEKSGWREREQSCRYYSVCSTQAVPLLIYLVSMFHNQLNFSWNDLWLWSQVSPHWRINQNSRRSLTPPRFLTFWRAAADHKRASQCFGFLKYSNVCVSWTALYFVFHSLSVWHHGRAVLLSADCRGLIVNKDTDSSQPQLCRGQTERTHRAGVMDLM